MKVRLISAAFILSLFLILPNVVIASAAEEEMEAFKESDLLKPASKMLSGSARMMVEGSDPRLGGEKALEETRSPSLQAPGAALVPYRSPSPKFSRNVLIPRDLGGLPYQTEPHIAVNPKDPNHIIVGMIDYNLPNVVNYVSIDGGATWEGPFQPRYLDYDLGSMGDPIVAFDQKGNAYFAYLSAGFEEFSIGGIPYEETVSSAVVARSEDGGYTWLRPVSAARSTVQVSEDELVLGHTDKPWMIVGADPANPGRDNIYVTYTHFKTHWKIIYIMEEQLFFFGDPFLETTIEFTRSTDGGLTWSEPVGVSPTVLRYYGAGVGEGQLGATTRVVQGSNMAIAPDGTLYVGWLDSTDDDSFKGLAEIWVARSDDGGQTFSKPVRVATFSEPDFSSRNAAFRSWGAAFPQMDTGPDGEVYIVFTARPPGRPVDDGDIYFALSQDRGETWSRMKRLNDDKTDRFQFFPAVAVDPNGTLHAMWGDFRDDPFEAKYHIYYTKSEDKGDKWIENARVTDFPSNPNYGFPRGEFIGDYFAMAANEDDVYMVWADTRLGEYGPLNQKIAFARTRLMPLPSIFVSPSIGPAGEDATIQGSNFQPDTDIFIEVGGVLLAYARTDEEGRFMSRIFIPVTGEGAHTIAAIDASGNVATASFYTAFGFNTFTDEFKGFKGTIEEVLGRLGTIEQRLENQSSSSNGSQQSSLTSEEVERIIDARLSGVTTLLWVVGGLAVIATVASLSSFIYLRRFQGRR